MLKRTHNKSSHGTKSSRRTSVKPQHCDEVPLVDEALHEEDVDDSDSVDDADIDHDLETEPVEEPTGDDDQIDDPVRIYLMQMGEIPLLKAKEELAAAKRIEIGRRRFRHCMLANDYVLQAAISLLESIRDNKVRLDRTIEVSVINIREKRRLLKVLDPNLHTLHHLLLHNRRDFTRGRSTIAIPEKNAAKHGGACCNAE